jgi:hypothetical protein
MGARVEGSAIVITWRGKQWRLWPGPEFIGVADSGAWSLFDYRESRVDGWTVIDNEPPHEEMDSEWGPKPFTRCSLRLRSTTPDFTTEVHVVFDGRRWGPYINIRSHFPRALAAHLASMLRISGPGELRLPSDYGADRSGDFLVLRDSGMELLRPAHDEKGPYETIMKWNMQFAPAFHWDSEEVTIRGWHVGASRAESPTAGWGVPQGAIERVDNDVVVSLAATAVGRGWHTVRTAPGTYALGVSFGR